MVNSKPQRISYSGYFYGSVALLLLVTGATKAAGLVHGFRGMKAANSVIPFFSNFQMICCAAAIELVVGCVLVFLRPVYVRRLLVYWIVSIFLSYRLGLMFVGDYSGCGCLQGLSVLLDSNKGVENAVAVGILAYMLIGNVTFHLLTWVDDWRRKEGVVPPQC
jgi:hypothetical protein